MQFFSRSFRDSADVFEERLPARKSRRRAHGAQVGTRPAGTERASKGCGQRIHIGIDRGHMTFSFGTFTGGPPGLCEQQKIDFLFFNNETLVGDFGAEWIQCG